MEFTNYVLGAIQKNRIYAIESMMATIHELIIKYFRPNILCDRGSGFTCDANLLGSLLKGSLMIGVWPRPKRPYLGINLKTLAAQIKGMQVFDKCEGGGRSFGFSCNHGIKDSIEASVRSLEDGILGLQLKSFLPETSKRSKKEEKR